MLLLSLSLIAVYLKPKVIASDIECERVLPRLGDLLSLGPIALLTYYTAEPNGTR